MSEPVTVTLAVDVLLPPVVVPPFRSFVAPVDVATVEVPVAVGVPETEHDIEAPAATVAGGAGVHVPTVTPAGRPLVEHVAFVALADALELFVHLIVPEYGTPILAEVGKPLRSTDMSEPVTAIEVVAELLPEFESFVAPVVPETLTVPVAVGVPETVQVMTPDGATLVGGVGEQLVVKPAGRPATAHVAAAAVTEGEAPFVHVNEPL